ncbi:MAG TPA: amidohydrolase family protein [Euzebya sp.]|nr:amidohydrolase family protein [Euzebya sp.]
MTATTALHVHGHLLPSGRSGSLWVTEGRLSFHEVPDALTVASNGWILPGLVDAHAHLGLHSPRPNGSPRQRAEASAHAHRDAGVLAVREPGSPDHVSATLGNGNGLPKVVTGGRFLAPPGGYVPGLAREVSATNLPAAAAEEALVSGAWVKVIGDFPAPEQGIVAHWDHETLLHTADAAHRAHARITIHATRPDVIEAAVLAGFDAVEHGTGMRHDQVDLLVERNVAWIPTLMISDHVRDLAGHLGGAAAVTDVDAWLDRLPEVVGHATRAGVPVFAGTDAGMGPHGRVVTEVAQLIAAGLNGDEALGAASWRARSWLGLPVLEEGAPADLVVYPTDPRADVDTLRRPTAIILDGCLVHPAPGSVGAGMPSPAAGRASPAADGGDVPAGANGRV